MNLLQFITDCDNNKDIEYTHQNGYIVARFHSAWSRFPDYRTDKMNDFLTFLRLWKA